MERSHCGAPQLLGSSPSLGKKQEQKAFQREFMAPLEGGSYGTMSFCLIQDPRECKRERPLWGRGGVKAARMSWTNKWRRTRIPAVSVARMETCSVCWKEGPGS